MRVPHGAGHSLRMQCGRSQGSGAAIGRQCADRWHGYSIEVVRRRVARTNERMALVSSETYYTPDAGVGGKCQRHCENTRQNTRKAIELCGERNAVHVSAVLH
jgi:hypothetical protein